MKFIRCIALPSIALGLLFCSCSSYQKQAGLIGGLAGAGLGAAFGDDHQDAIAGALVGAAVGAGGAAIHEKSRQDPRQYERYGIPPDEPASPPQHQGIHDPQGQLGPVVDPEPAAPNYPVARRTNNADEVESPYPPHHRINISGFRSGQLAKDPKSGKIFRVP
jgi:hypothetical protein